MCRRQSVRNLGAGINISRRQKIWWVSKMETWKVRCSHFHPSSLPPSLSALAASAVCSLAIPLLCLPVAPCTHKRLFLFLSFESSFIAACNSSYSTFQNVALWYNIQTELAGLFLPSPNKRQRWQQAGLFWNSITFLSRHPKRALYYLAPMRKWGHVTQPCWRSTSCVLKKQNAAAVLPGPRASVLSGYYNNLWDNLSSRPCVIVHCDEK